MKKALDKIVNAIDRQREKKNSSPWVWLILIPLVLAGIAIAAWVSTKDRRELAKLRHEKNKREIESENAFAEAEAKKSEAEAEEALKRVAEAEAEIITIDKRLKEVEKRHDENKELIERVTWDDLPVGK